MAEIDHCTPLQRRLIDLYRINQERSQFVSRAYGAELSTRELFVLVEIAFASSRTATQIAKSLNLEKSLVSRTIVSLKKRAYLTCRRNGDDRRSNILTLTEKASRAFAIHDQFNAREIELRAGRITSEEYSQLQDFFSKAADNMGAGPAILRPGENPALGPMRRIVYGSGVLGDNIFGSGYSTVDWQVLTAIARGKGTVRSIDLCARFKILPNTVSVLLKRYAKMRYLLRRTISEDKRSVALSLAPAGLKTLEHIEQCLLRSGLATCVLQDSEEVVQKHLDIFAQYIGESAPAQRLALQVQTIERLNSDAGRSAARNFLILEMVRRNESSHAPELLIGSQNACFVLKRNNIIRAVAEVRYGDGEAALVNFAYSGDLQSDGIGADFVNACLEEICRERSLQMLKIEIQGSARVWAKSQSNSIHDRGTVFLTPQRAF